MHQAKNQKEFKCYNNIHLKLSCILLVVFVFWCEILVLHMHATIAIDWKILQDATEFPRSFTFLQLIFSILFMAVYLIFKQYGLRKLYTSA